MPDVSVIIPNYNHAPYLEERIGSVLQQSFGDLELIILDDASTDGSREIIDRYRDHPKVSHVIYNTTNSGHPWQQWQKGIRLSKGKWIWIAESDDAADPLFLQQLVSLGEKHPGIAFVYCDSYIKKESGTLPMSKYAEKKNRELKTTKWDHPYFLDGETEINQSLKWQCTVNNASAVLFSRDYLLDEIASVTDLRYHGDWLLYLRLAQKSKIAYLPAPLNIYRDHPKDASTGEGYNKYSKIEHFRILDHLLSLDFISNKKDLIRHFTNHYIGFGIIREKGLGSNGVYRSYRRINKDLAGKVLARILIHKITGK